VTSASAAPPGNSTTALPSAARSTPSQPRRDALRSPCSRQYSRKSGVLKLSAKVIGYGVMPGNAARHSASRATNAFQPLTAVMPCGAATST
jgi:hypothetical protein